jgi:NAD(P)H-dependent flavin oxidoreductase YrpB (nitropropane dioxygenase family)
VKIVETAGANPAPHLPAFKAAGVNVVHKAVAVRHALKAERLGVDTISIDGFECAGQSGDDDVPGLVLVLVLVPAAARPLSIPVIASGGIATGAGLVAALALWASAVNMGTRFVTTTEAPVHENVKRQIVANDERASQVVLREFHDTARVARNSVSEQIVEISRRPGATFADVAELASGARGRSAVLRDGDMEGGMRWPGQSQGLVDEVASCADVVRSIVDEAEELLGKTLPAVLGG